MVARPGAGIAFAATVAAYPLQSIDVFPVEGGYARDATSNPRVHAVKVV